MNDAEGEIKKATDTLLHLLQESGDKTQAIANYYASVAYWESKGESASDLPDAAIELMKAEEAKAFMEHRKIYAANKAAEGKKKEDAYWSKFFWAMCLLGVVFFPAYYLHRDNLVTARKARAEYFIIQHIQRVTGVIGTSEFPAEQGVLLEHDYADAFKKEFKNYLDVKRKLQGVQYDSPDPTDVGSYADAAKVIKLKLPLKNAQGVLEYTIEDTSHGKKPPVIIATNELDITLPERDEGAVKSQKAELSRRENQRKLAESGALKEVKRLIEAAVVGDIEQYNSSRVLAKCNVNTADYVELWRSPVLNAKIALNEGLDKAVVSVTFNRTSMPNSAILTLEYLSQRWWIADIQVPNSQNQQQGYQQHQENNYPESSQNIPAQSEYSAPSQPQYAMPPEQDWGKNAERRNLREQNPSGVKPGFE